MGFKDCTGLLCLLIWTCFKEAAVMHHIFFCGNSGWHKQFNTAPPFRRKSPGVAGFLALVQLPAGTEARSRWICSYHWDMLWSKEHCVKVISPDLCSWEHIPPQLTSYPTPWNNLSLLVFASVQHKYGATQIWGIIINNTHSIWTLVRS